MAEVLVERGVFNSPFILNWRSPRLPLSGPTTRVPFFFFLLHCENQNIYVYKCTAICKLPALINLYLIIKKIRFLAKFSSNLKLPMKLIKITVRINA
jgi:hypothetical protein